MILTGLLAHPDDQVWRLLCTALHPDRSVREGDSDFASEAGARAAEARMAVWLL
jgi:hypothetical protein